MAAYTTSQDGNWSSASTWGGTGPPGAGDTTTIKHNVTVTASVTVGSSPNTGGTPAIDFELLSEFPITFTLNAGVVLTLQGDVYNRQGLTITMGAGSQWIWKPPSGQQYFLIVPAIYDYNNYNIYWTCSGTSGSHCVIKTDTSLGGLNACFEPYTGGGQDLTFTSASYVDFTNIGTSTQAGVLMFLDHASSNSACSMTNCTFTGCNVSMVFGSNNGWDGTFLFQNCTFTSSVGITLNGVASSCFGVAFLSAVSAGSRTINLCSFDLTMANGAFKECTLSNTYLGASVTYLTGSTWATASYWNTNLINATVTLPNLLGSIENVYFVSTGSGHLSACAVTATLTGCIFDIATVGTESKALLTGTPTGAITITFQNCITLPQEPSGFGIQILNLFGATTDPNYYNTVDVYHCTICCTENFGLHYSENGATGAGQLGAIKANYFWSSSLTGGTTCFKTIDVGSPTTGGTSNVFSPTNADYNGSHNIYTGEPSTYTGNTYTYAGNGYQGNFTAYPGTHDLADQDPLFVDTTRNLASWGGTTAGGGTATWAAAIAQIAANPALIGQATTGLLAWVRAGFRPQNSALEAASYPSDPSTSDAAGNAWPGGSPGIGAMAWQSGQTTIFRQCSMSGLGSGGEFFCNPLS